MSGLLVFVAAVCVGLIVLTVAIVQTLLGGRGHTRSTGDVLIGGVLIAFAAVVIVEYVGATLP